MSETDNAAPVVAEASPATPQELSSQQPSEATPQQPTGPKLSRKIKLKIDGEEVDEELPFDYDESDTKQVDYLKRTLQLSKVANKRMNESAMTKKQAEQFIQALQNDPMRVLSNPKLMGEEKFQKIAEEFLAKKIQAQMMTPEERQRSEMEERLRKYEEQEKSNKEKAEQEQMQALQTHYQESYTKTITQALESSNLPKNPYTVKRMAQLLQQNIKHGLELEPAHLAQLVREDYQKELASLISAANPEQIISMFGEETVNKLRKHDLEKLKSSLSPQQRAAPKQEVENVPVKPRKWSDFNEELKRKVRNEA
jgi:hypothetical protein